MTQFIEHLAFQSHHKVFLFSIICLLSDAYIIFDQSAFNTSSIQLCFMKLTLKEHKRGHFDHNIGLQS